MLDLLEVVLIGLLVHPELLFVLLDLPLGLLQLQRELGGGLAVPGLEIGLGLRGELVEVSLAVLDLARHALHQAAVLLQAHAAFLELLDREIVLVLHLRNRIGFPEKVGELVELRPNRTEELLEDHQVLP